MSVLSTQKNKLKVVELKNAGYSSRKIAEIMGTGKSTINDFLSKETHKTFWAAQSGAELLKKIGPKVLTLDIETAPMRGLFWGIWQQNIPLSRIEQDWYILSWAAKWMHEDDVQYEDKRDSWNTDSDYELLKGIWELLDEADFIITQNGKKFDEKKLNSRFLDNGMPPPSAYRHIDVLQISKKHFGNTSNKLEYMTNKYCKQYKKLKHGKFPGNELWDECLKGNMEAWDEMEEYNIYDVLSLEELYMIIRPYYKGHPNFSLYYDDNKTRCNCGSEDFTHAGHICTNLSKYDLFTCNSCGASSRGRVNLLSKEKRQSLRANVL